MKYPKHPESSSLRAIVQKIASRSPGASAVIAPNGECCGYGELLAQIDSVGVALRAWNIERTDRVALVLPNGPEVATAFLGVAAYAECAPLNPAYTRDELEFYLTDLKAKALVVAANGSSPAREVAETLGLKVINLETSAQHAGSFILRGASADEPNPTNNDWGRDDEIALVLHTSGTTSRPKQVPLSHANLCASASNVAEVIALSNTDSCLNVMPMFHIHGLVGVLLASLHAGGSVVCSNGYDPRTFPALIKDFKPTWFSAVPTIHQAILALAKEDSTVTFGKHLRFIRSSSSALPPSVMAEMEDAFGVPVIESYGMTEAAHQMASNPLPPAERKPGTVGLPAGPKMAIMDRAGGMLPVGETGEIVISGSNVMAGYVNNVDANEAAFTDGWFRTGDLGYADRDGYFYITGRTKEMINRGGENISPREIDERLLEHTAVAQAVAFAVPHKSLGQDVAAAVVLHGGEKLTEGELREFAIERLAEFKVPSQIVFVAEIPKGPTGKVQRIGLHEKLASELTGDFLAPVTALEEQLAQIWSEVLVVDPVGMNDNFFQLGGDSLRAGQLLSRIRTTLEVELSFRDLLLAPTPAGVVNRIGRLRTGQAQSRASTMQMPSVTEDPERKSEPFPLTDIQQSYWVGRNPAFELGNVSIHSYTEVECIDLDLDRFARIWLRLVERHDMLRCIVLPDGLQQILPEVPNYQIETFDLRGDAVDNLDARLDEIRERMSHQVRRADVWPLFEICVSRLDERLSRVHFSFDGMVLDAWSRFLLFKELTQLYRNPETNLVPLELSFRDYVLAESKFRNSDLYLRSEKYWHNHLRSLTPAPKLPLAADASSIEDPRFVRRSGKLPAEIWTQLKSRVHKKGLTTVGMLVAAFAEVVAVWSNSRKFTLNVPYYNRLPLHRQVGEILGDFSSLTLLAVDNTGESSFEDRARRLQEQLWKDLDHSYYSGIRVLRELAKVLGRNTGALMPVVFTSAPQDPGRDDISPTTVLEDLGEVVCSVSQTPQVWLDVQVYEEADGLVFHWNAVEALFPSGLMEDMFDAYCRLLNRFAGEERTWLETSAEMALRMIPPTLIEQRELINATEAPMPDELLQTLFARQARERPNQPAVITSNRTMTYEELSHQAKQVGRRLREMGARPNVLVAVVMEKGWEPVVAVLGILMSGSACLPIDPKVPEERLCYLLENGEVELVLTQPCLRDTLTWPRSVQCFCVDDETFEDAGIEPLDPVQNSDDLAFVIYTSGSTGLPKGVMIEHRSIANAVCAANARFRVGPEDRVLALTPLHHDLSLYDIFGMLAAGGGIVMPEESGRRDPAHWATLMTAERVTVWNSVPTMMKMLIEYVDGRENRWPDELRLAFLGGDWIPVALPKQLKVLAESCQVVSIGGPTETTIWNIWYPIHTVDPSLKSIPYGRPIANSKYYVLSDLLEHCPISVPGHLYCAGIGLAKGYWRDSDKTQANFITHPRTGERLYRTGDLGCYLQDGNIEFLGREDSQVQIYGNRVELGEIEAALMLHSGVRSAVVAAVGKLHEEKRLVGYVVLEHGFTSPLEELRRFLRQKLPVHMIPGSFVKLEELPLTSNGKLDRKSLPDPAEKLVDSSQPDRAGQPDETRRITSLVEEILKVDSLEPDANWLNLGATSVDMIRIANLLDKELGFRPKIDQLYREPTAIALAHAYQLKFQKPADGVEWTMPTVPTSFVTTKLLVDPEEREAFKKRQRGLRSGGADETSIHLATSRSGDALRKQFTERRSYRQFENQPLPFQQFSEFFGCLRQIRLSGVPKYLYPSGGGLYCVQSYLYIKQGRVEGLAAGAYYYHPVDHRLVQISADAKLDAMIYSRLVNRPIYDEAGFAIFLIAELAAIVPMYGDRSINLATLEAGYMGQLLMMSAPAYEIGLCPIGSLDFDRIRDLFALEESHVLVHSMLGGRVDHGRALRFESFQECYDSEEAASENREEGEI